MTAGPGALLLGLDAGGTRTRALLAGRGGETLWRGEGGAASLTRVGSEGVVKVVAHLWRHQDAGGTKRIDDVAGLQGELLQLARDAGIDHRLRQRRLCLGQ